MCQQGVCVSLGHPATTTRHPATIPTDGIDQDGDGFGTGDDRRLPMPVAKKTTG